jgi:broad specificity phosphatase PhoE
MLLGSLLLLLQAAGSPLASLPPVPAGALRVYLVRHGQSLSNLDPTPDLPAEQLDHLTELGAQQADRSAEALRGCGLHEVFTSPASRARETADRMAKTLGLPPPTVEPRLAPLKMGRHPDGGEVDFDERVADWLAGRDPVPPEGESLGQVGDRVAKAVGALPRAAGSRSILVVAHGEVIASYLGRVRGASPPKRYPFGLANASISVVDVAKDGTAAVLLANFKPEP